MAKIGTAHIEIKPVIDEAALKSITENIADAVAAGLAEGMARTGRIETLSPVSGSMSAVITDALTTQRRT